LLEANNYLPLKKMARLADGRQHLPHHLERQPLFAIDPAVYSAKALYYQYMDHRYLFPLIARAGTSNRESPTAVK
jgi:hypothetical protein